MRQSFVLIDKDAGICFDVLRKKIRIQVLRSAQQITKCF